MQNKDFVDEEGIAIALVLSFESSSVYGTELNAPETDRFAADDDASFSEKIFNISVAQVEAVVEPDSV